MARSVSYPKFVDISSIKLQEIGNYRYWLKVPFKNQRNSKILCVILKNPSKANNKTCDDTVRRVCNVANNHGYSEVIILNLFPYRSTNPKGLLNFYSNKYFKLIMACNLRKIIKICKNKDVVFAWGTNTISSLKQNKNIYDLAITNITSIIKNNTYFVKCCKCGYQTCNNQYKASNSQHQHIRYPSHGLVWKNNSPMIRY